MKIFRIVLFLLVLLSSLWAFYRILTYQENLHCTQWSSFRIAVFDMQPHIEEKSIPPIYVHPYAVPLRILFSAGALAIPFSPLFWSLWATWRKLRSGAYLKRLWLSFAAGTALFALSFFLAGERFFDVYLTTLLTSLPVYAIASALAAKPDRCRLA